ncbi:MAG: ABC transporter ATP-binding protein [Lysobacteraceae bacterium]|nr:MAG: ABC transporter ATP-binding protein [Xanthomonadaceae bacterium]
MIWATVCSVVNKLFDIAPEILIGIAIDVVVRQQDSFIAEMGLTDPVQQMMALGVLTLLVWGGESLFEYFHLLLWRGLAQDIQHDFRMQAYRHVQQLEMAWFEDRRVGDLVSILNDDVNQLERFLNGGANSLIQVATTLVAVGSVFFFISPMIALFAFTPIPIILWGAFYFQRRAQPLYADVRDLVGRLSARLNGNLNGIATIKSFAAERLEAETLAAQSARYVEANRKAIRISSAFIPVIRMAILAGFLVTLVVGGIKTLNGELNTGLYGVLVFLTQRLLWPMTGLAETVDLYERAMASTRRIVNLIETPIAIRDGEQALALRDSRGEVAFERVSMAYGDGAQVLSDVSLHVEPGQTVALVGPTGSGKSSLIKLLLRFYSPTKGRILIDGQPIDELTLDSVRQAIGFVSQDVFLFDGTVAENIAYGKVDASMDEITDAAAQAEALGFIQALPNGFDTLVGERGQKLSGGQRQRLSIARALLKDSPILVLDEATSAVDNETEQAIQRSLQRLAGCKTTLVIAHRLSTIVHADQILVIEQGQVTQRGTHQSLLEQDGLYRTLWAVQTGAAGS